MGLVCFRLKDKDNMANEKLNARINADGRIHMTPAYIGDIYILRYETTETPRRPINAAQ